ncbi:XRE family transcriptional regulator [Cupriavidus sp. SK-4]|uniref:helix-turn-helix domain-containing protein n=1 Tax=Cupriavidus sp. SK-4 TaxID=574750 RepID=UPI00044B9A3C|nr:helix-turn-helix transcriptional regulator [Cupriavidus sp. SK-4]EYS98176.1 XRE family transcriptional regulator [Cupriavidus sp. SK-4]
MNATENTPPGRLLTPAELAVCITVFRDARRWTQEQLAVIAGLNVRTIQRVEHGWPAGPDTCRALASAFDFADTEAFNKPFAIPSEDALKAVQDQFNQEHVTFTAIPLSTGEQLARLAQTSTMDVSELAIDMGREADRRFAALMEDFRNYRDCADVYTETQKRKVYNTMQACIDVLKTLGVSLRYAEHKVLLKWGSDPDSNPMSANVLYVIGFPVGKEPVLFATPKSGGFRL